MISAVLLLASFSAAAEPAPRARLTRQECPAPRSDKERGAIGDRAIISDDGGKVVVQCGDGTVRIWQTGMTTFRPVGTMPLIQAARLNGIVPADLRCPWSSLIGDSMKIEADCDILDHDADKKLYVLRSAGSVDSFVVAGPHLVREATEWQRFGALLPEEPATLAIVDGQTHPELVQRLSIGDDRATPIAPLTDQSLIFEDSQGEAIGIAYSKPYDTIVVSFGGAFRVAERMTYVRAFGRDGKERWSIPGALPRRDDDGITGDQAAVSLFANGRYALFAKTHDRDFALMIDLRDGRAVGSLRGWPLAASIGANIGVVEDALGTLSIIDLDVPDAR